MSCTQCSMLRQVKYPTLGNWEYLVWTHSLIISSLRLPLAAAHISWSSFRASSIETLDISLLNTDCPICLLYNRVYKLKKKCIRYYSLEHVISIYLVDTLIFFCVIGEPNSFEFGNEDCVLIESDDKNWIHNRYTSWKDYPCCKEVGVSEVLCQLGISV